MPNVTHARKLALAGRRTARVLIKMLKGLRPFFRRPGNFPLHRFKQKVAVFQTSENFVLKTAANPFELRQALQLRHEIFYKELQNRETFDRLDMDELDLVCDHLLICEKLSGRVVGPARLSTCYGRA